VLLALTLGASRIEIAHVQYYGWALKNRAALMPSRNQSSCSQVVVLPEPLLGSTSWPS
jgi:PqqA peptide cyclase